jgi:citrate lyase beta subunit
MLIISQNLTNYQVNIPQDAIFRINLAWINSLKELQDILERHQTRQIFLDLPANRTKPPNNKYDIDELTSIIKSNQNIKYFAVSNINSADDLEMYFNVIPENVILVPKIESVEGISNIKQITDALGTNRIIMLDHDDLHSSIIKSKQPISKFLECFNTLVEYCKNNNVVLLRTVGVVFSDEEKKVSDYIG